jgi:hypothetical protein
MLSIKLHAQYPYEVGQIFTFAGILSISGIIPTVKKIKKLFNRAIGSI